jgi:GT2 family glycosyltransferase
VTHQNADLVERCIDALRQAVQRHVQEIIVVDNASTDGTPQAVVALEPTARVLALSRNVGFAAANNVALSRARGRYVALINSDCFPQKGALDILIEAADRHPAAGLVGGTLRYGDGKHQPSAGCLPTLGSELWLAMGLHRAPLLERRGIGLLFAESLYRHRRTVGWVSGAFCIARPAIGEMPTGGFMYGEDVEWARQAAERGFEVWLEPAASAVHLGGHSVSRSQDPYFVDTQRVRFALRWFAPRGLGAVLLERLILLLHASVRLLAILLMVPFGNRSASGAITRFVSIARVTMTAKTRRDEPDPASTSQVLAVSELSAR